MEKLLEKLFDFNNIPTRLILVLLVISAILLFAPLDFLVRLHLDQFNKDYGKFIGITFLASLGFLIATIIASLISRNNRIKRRNEVLRTISNLDRHEQALLREFLIKGKRTLQLPIDDATVTGLHAHGVLTHMSATGFTYVHGIYFPFSLTEVAFKEIHQNPQLVGFPSQRDGITDEKKEEILKSRPKWSIDRDDFESAF